MTVSVRRALLGPTVACVLFARQEPIRTSREKACAGRVLKTPSQRLAVITLLVVSAQKVSQVPTEAHVDLATLGATRLFPVIPHARLARQAHTRIQVDMECVLLVHQELVHPRAALQVEIVPAFEVMWVESLRASLVISASIRVQMEAVLIVPHVYAQSGNIGRHVRSKLGHWMPCA